jgi:hypothetical protein
MKKTVRISVVAVVVLAGIAAWENHVSSDMKHGLRSTFAAVNAPCDQQCIDDSVLLLRSHAVTLRDRHLVSVWEGIISDGTVLDHVDYARGYQEAKYTDEHHGAVAVDAWDETPEGKANVAEAARLQASIRSRINTLRIVAGLLPIN